MATQVEVKSMDVGRAGGLGGRLHLSPLADSSNKNPVEGSGPGSLILSPESAKPVPGPKPRLTPKPYMSEKTATVRPILAPKPNTKTRVDLAQPGSLKSDLPSTPKPSASLANYPAPATMTPTPKPGLTQTPRLHVLSRPTSISAEVGPQGADFRQPKAKAPTSAEWSGTTERGQALEKPGSRERPIVRAKSMGYLSHLERDSAKDQVTEDSSAKGVTSVRSGTWKNLKPRPISAILLPAEAQAETIAPDPIPRWKGRRPLSTDLTAKFEFVGLSLHRRPSRTDAKENTPERVSEDNSMPSGRGECEKGAESVTSSVPEHRPKPSLPERKNEKEDIREEVRTSDGIKRRITLLFDSALPAPAAESLPAGEPRTPTQSAVNANTPMGVKQRIQKLTEDSPSTPAPTPRMLFKPRPLPPDLTKRFAVEKSEELSCSPPSPQGREMPKPCSGSDGKLDDPASTNPMEGEEGEDRFPNPSDRLLQERQELSAEGTKGGSQTESRIVPGIPGTVVQTVRAALFENVVERHSVRVLEDPTFAARPRRSLSLRYGDEQARAHNSLRVDHMFDTVPAVGERRATSERVSIAQLEEKAMTLRSRGEVQQKVCSNPLRQRRYRDPLCPWAPRQSPVF
ncbi:uncharacterized protein KIAA1671-like [Brienomyrus brachyistius]|uniref:uncharacterized protein KIAA1671-like n=1 Tax=Brienomyrus brachyistius TaxID=42636 RepID=UPI0020B20FAC|nr:uncharacterized protein KIAA1671-like [Brienomyrus brachyistius]XP_048856316.1 uncharacterized protein KIAA1671-like [Brienomyrus brachyistius]